LLPGLSIGERYTAVTSLSGNSRSIKACCLLGLAVVPDANRVVCDTCQVATPSRLEIEPSSRGAKASVVGGLTNEF
jgi:hypothetical protein